MKVLIIDNGTSYLEKLKALFIGSVVEVIEYNQISRVKIEDIDLIILSGGHGTPVINKQNFYTSEINFIKTSSVPILGICLGYELIAHAFGAELELMEVREKGILNIIPIKQSNLFIGVKNFSVYESHRWVVKKLPKELIGLAKSKDGWEIINYSGKPLIYGFQFHPEMFTDQTSGNQIFKNFLKIAGL
jgi:anthranilate/para-aminobenzoate synthase component II